MGQAILLAETILKMKKMLEEAIATSYVNGSMKANGALAKEGLIRSKALINELHECVKKSLQEQGVFAKNIFPPINSTSPELKLSGFLKKKDQDICVVPSNIEPKRTKITWGPLAFEGETDLYGKEYTENTLIINVRSQMSSLAKNADTLFERTFAETTNLHTIYPEAILGEVYLIPVYEYDQEFAKKNIVKYKENRTNLEKYISFFTAINGRNDSSDDIYKYERCALIIVDFSHEEPIIYNSTDMLKRDGLVSPSFPLELADISYDNFIEDLLEIYNQRFKIDNICQREFAMV